VKQVSVEEARKRLTELLEQAGDEAVVILRDGKPVGVLCAWPDLDIEMDIESLERASSPDFWRMIDARRKSPTVPWAQAKKEAGL
jgi:PHD/YefM family antitoxin component YafN of YafNO toxin-antitoxin module